MKATKILICILCCTWICSCSLLEVDPVSTITSQSFWKTSGDAKAYLTGIYNKVRDLNNTSYYIIRDFQNFFALTLISL